MTLSWKGMDTNRAITTDTIKSVVDWFREQNKEQFTSKEITGNLFRYLQNKENASNPSGLLTWVHASGLINKNEQVLPLLQKLINQEISEEEYSLIYLSKLGVYENNNAKYLQIVFICKYLEKNNFPPLNEKTLVNIAKYKDYSIGKAQRDKGISRGDLLLNALNATGLFNPKKTSTNGALSEIEIKDNAKEIIKSIAQFGEKMTLPPNRSSNNQNNKHYSFYGDLEHGIFEILDNIQSASFKTFFPNLKKILSTLKTSSTFNVYQKIFFGAPGTGKSFSLKKITKAHQLLKDNASTRANEFKKSPFCKSNYDSYLKTSIKSILGKSIYELDSMRKLEEAREELERSPNSKVSDYRSGLNGYISFAEKELLIDSTFRTTFHPDYDYAQFVGAYKPHYDKKDQKITYSFVPQVFATAYVSAWKKFLDANCTSIFENQVFLVIEEINRGNCAQIFGDIFQLLDRDENGFSQYPIDADKDFYDWLKDESILKDEDTQKKYKKYVSDGKLQFPPNLNILATMNTSDQSLFPMDSAFKRRFDWQYEPIKYEAPKNKKGGADENWDADKYTISFSYIEMKDAKEEKISRTIYWINFLKKINADIYKVTECEDKQMGEFFIKPKSGTEISLDEFRSKVLFYLWDSVYKDETDKKSIFHFKYPNDDGSVVTFQRLFEDDFEKILEKMLEKLDKTYEGAEFKGFEILGKKP